MNRQKRLFEERATYPLFFYPMFHPTKHRLTGPGIEAFYRGLEHPCQTPTADDIYVHIPFCDSFCHMCACYKTHTPRDPRVMVDYVESVKKEAAAYARTPYVRSLNLECLYFGGGTPSTLPAPLIRELVSYTRECFSLPDHAEITFEGDVRTLKDKERIKALVESGCNRVSFGVQTFSQEARKLTGLVPGEREILTCIDNLRQAGYKINFDLMYGLPGQTPDTWKRDLDRALELEVDGLDIYEAVLYPTTKLFRFRHRLTMADEDQRLEMLAYALDILERQGLIQRSNAIHEKPGNRFKLLDVGDRLHNTVAVGDNAIGCLDGFAYRNLSPFSSYQNPPPAVPLPMRSGFRLDQLDRYTKKMFILAKRLKLDKDDARAEIDHFRDTLDRLIAKGVLREDDKEIRVTREGRLWCDNISWEFLHPRQRRLVWKIMY